MKTRINSIFLFLVFTSQIFISTSSPLFADEIYLQNEQPNLPNNEKKSSASIVNNNDEKKNKVVEEGIWDNWRYLKDTSTKTITLTGYEKTSESSFNDVVIPTSNDFNLPDYNVQIGFTGLQSAGENAHILRTSGNGAPIKFIDSSLDSLFLKNINIQEIDLNNLDVSSVVDMRYMFTGCVKLTQLNISDWDTQKVTNMNGMFSGCTNLQNLDISQWNVQGVTNMQFAFAYSALSYLNLQNWHLQTGVNLSALFVAGSETPLLVTTTDDKLLNYNYTADNRTKMGTLKIDPKLGNFNGQATDSLFDYTINQPLTDELINQQLEKGKDRLTLNERVKFDHWQAESTYATTLEKA
ncbi:BspA family leucine-rich repeat surface protein, partial [Enterococcus faecium]